MSEKNKKIRNFVCASAAILAVGGAVAWREKDFEDFCLQRATAEMQGLVYTMSQRIMAPLQNH